MKIRPYILTGLIIICIVILWHSLCHFKVLPSFVLASPKEVVSAIRRHSVIILHGAANTTMTALTGFTAAFVFGLSIGILMQRSQSIYRIVLPMMVSVKSVPIIALVPIVTLLLGVGWISKLFLTFLICFFPMVITSYSGIQSVSQGLNDFAMSVCDSKLRHFVHIILPSSADRLLLGMKITVPLAFVGSVVAEMSGGDEQGIGYIIMCSNYRLDTPLLYAGIIALSLTATGTFYIVTGFTGLFKKRF